MLAQTIVDKAIKGSAKFAEMILDRIDGKVVQRQEITGPDDGPLTLAHSPEEREVMREIGREPIEGLLEASWQKALVEGEKEITEGG